MPLTGCYLRRQRGENLFVGFLAVAVEEVDAVSPAHTDISYVVPPTPVTFFTLLWRLGLRVAPWALGWQSICPLTFMASLGVKRRTKKIIQRKEGKEIQHEPNMMGCGSMHIAWMEHDSFKMTKTE